MNLLDIELIKLKNTFALWLTFVGALFLPLLLFTTYLFESQEFLPAPRINPWYDYLLRTFNGCCFFSLGFILLIIGLILNIEHKANSWKQLFTLPVRRGRLYRAKTTLIFSVITVFFLLYFVFAITSGQLLGLIKPSLGFRQYRVPYDYIFRFLLDLFVSIIPMIIIQYWISFRMRNLITSLGMGLFGLLMGLLLKNWDHIIYLPYATPFQMLNYKETDVLNRQHFYLVNAGYSLLFIVLSYKDFTKRFQG
ncbi:ABC transporter permease [Flavitalea sp. BT771]|uniref:ABC transporter permease n=1 Tax=Flavitalea sp. BT771 TaxID=3063329 RepID=UPI0026E40E63|nr:ABC transporter permease [Flavitalea sp. BT771]MDO6432626.1 ABC transporter permease [Flavitalea sp. BT771]MDV6222098.1 ABC transporter permease [Flavitalea sp. BT771]